MNKLFNIGGRGWYIGKRFGEEGRAGDREVPYRDA
jgi:hypothetical protein